MWNAEPKTVSNHIDAHIFWTLKKMDFGDWAKKLKKKSKLEYLPRVTFLSAERLLFFHA